MPKIDLKMWAEYKIFEIEQLAAEIKENKYKLGTLKNTYFTPNFRRAVLSA